MSEMVEKQVRYYCAGIAPLLSPEGVFFDQNHDGRSLGMLDARRVIAECLPYGLPLRSLAMPPTQGTAHLWSPRHFPPYPWLPAAEVVPPKRGAVGAVVRRLGGQLLRTCGLP